MSLIPYASLSNFPNSILIGCEVCPRYLKNSLIFTIPFKVSELSSKVKKINFHQYLPIILYDKGSMYSSSRLYCYLIAAGYTNVKVLYGGLESCESNQSALTDEEPSPVPLTERIPLPLNETFLITKEEFMQMNTSNLDSVYANFLYKHAFEFQSKLSQENILKFLASCGISLTGSKNCIFYGEVSSLLALFANFLGFSTFLVVMDDFDTSVIYKTLTSCAETIYDSIDSVVSKSYTSAELEHYVSSGLSIKSKSLVSNENHLSTAPCCGCLII